MFISEFLERCTKMRTSNPNESFKSQIWRRAPKELPLWKPTVDIVVAMVVLEFNKGSSGFISVLGELEHSFKAGIADQREVVRQPNSKIDLKWDLEYIQCFLMDSDSQHHI